MSLAGYQDFDDCESKNQDKKDPAAYCGPIKHKKAMQELRKAVDAFEISTPEDKDPAVVLAGVAKLRTSLSH